MTSEEFTCRVNKLYSAKEIAEYHDEWIGKLTNKSKKLGLQSGFGGIAPKHYSPHLIMGLRRFDGYVVWQTVKGDSPRSSFVATQMTVWTTTFAPVSTTHGTGYLLFSNEHTHLGEVNFNSDLIGLAASHCAKHQIHNINL